MSEIDDIFASKGKAKALSPPPASSAVKSSKKKQKKQVSISLDDPSEPSAESKDVTHSHPGSSKKRRMPETIVDTSNDVSVSSKRQKIDKTKKSKAGKGEKQEESDLTNFKDSRGSSGRRTTSEGWLIYKEDELGLSKEGGDTPLCPFDCDCCF